MAQKKKSGSKSGRNNSKRSSTKKQNKKAEGQYSADQRVVQEIWSLVLVAVGVFLFAAVQFHIAGAFGNILGDGLKGIFGMLGYLMPWYIVFYGVLLFINKKEWITLRTFLLTLIIVLMLCLFNSARFINPETGYDFINFFEDGVMLNSGGILGMTMGLFTIKLIGKVGLYTLSIVIILINILLLINTPISKGIDTLKEKNEEFIEKRRERHSEPEDLSMSFDKHDQLKIITPYEETGYKENLLESSRKKEKKKQLLQYMQDDNLFSTGNEKGENERSYGLEEKVTINTGFGLHNEVPPKSEPETAFVTTHDDIFMEEQPKLTKNEAAAMTLSKDEIAQSEKKTIKYKKPSINLLNKPKATNQGSISSDLKTKATTLEETLKSFNVDARVVQVTQGPAVTRYEIQPNVGVKVSSIVRLSDDIALNLRAKSIRIEAPIPGKAAVGIEVENDKINMVTLREIIDSKEFKNAESKITFAVGKDIAGKAIVADLKGMPHLLIAGSTGSGKSVCINSIITSILYKANPDEVKLVLIDPKVVELGNYNGIPHLLIPVVTEPVKAAAALNWAVAEMTDRYKKFADSQVRDLESYNDTMRLNSDDDLVMPQIVIIIDELADLMMAAPSQVEESICRLAQMARAAGMHLIVATQRPSVDIITGVIKANIPSRIAFAVSSQFDSRTILDMSGAEKLVGKGDMLFNPLGMGKPVRVQGTFVSDAEVHSVIEHVKAQVQEVEYSGDVMETIEKGNAVDTKDDDGDELLSDAIECVVHAGQASVSMLQRRFRIGYNRAARIVDMMEARGIVGPQDGSRPRQVLLTEDELEEMKKDVEG